MILYLSSIGSTSTWSISQHCIHMTLFLRKVQIWVQITYKHIEKGEGIKKNVASKEYAVLLSCVSSSLGSILVRLLQKNKIYLLKKIQVKLSFKGSGLIFIFIVFYIFIFNLIFIYFYIMNFYRLIPSFVLCDDMCATCCCNLVTTAATNSSLQP